MNQDQSSKKGFVQDSSRDPFEVGFAVFTNPPFIQKETYLSDEVKKNIQFEQYVALDYKIDSAELKQKWLEITNSKKTVIQPIYSAFCQSKGQFVLGEYEKMLVTGGVVYDGSGKSEQDLIPKTVAFCYQVIRRKGESGSWHLQMNAYKIGGVVETPEGEEVDEIVEFVKPMNQARHNHKLFRVPKHNNQNESNYYAVGGQSYNYSEKDGSKVEFLKTVERYDEEKNQWEQVAPMNVQRSAFSGFVHNGKIYVFGGINQNDYIQRTQSEVFENGQWKLLQMKLKMKVQNQLLGAVCVPLQHDKVLVLGGAYNDEGPSNEITFLDMSKSTLTFEPLKNKLKLKYPRANAQYQLIRKGGKQYLVVLGGNPAGLSFELYQVEQSADGTINLTFVKEQDVLSKMMDETMKEYSFVGYRGEQAWISSVISMPVMSLSDLEQV